MEIASKIGVELNPPTYVGRACGTCKHYDRDDSAFFSKCRFYSCFAQQARLHQKLCGVTGKNWEPRPPRVGLLKWARRLLWGAR
jgi:hypothetical protein